MPARLLTGRIATRAAAWLLGLYLDCTLRSTRWTVEGAENLAPFLAGGGVIVACWHERLALAPAFWIRARRLYPDRPVSALASRHRDGQFIAAVLRRFGVQAVHGSSSRGRPGEARVRDRGGAAGLRALRTALDQGHAVVITPDGPRGPRREAASGAALLAALAGAPVLAAAGQLRHRIVLRSWDNMVVPLPFGRGALVCLAPMHVSRDGVEAGQAAMQAALNLAADRADTLCR